MIFFAFGVNHLRAPVEVREAFALDEEGKRRLHRSVSLADGSELLLLSTCNRTEAYVYGHPEDVDSVREALSSIAGTPWPHDAAFFFRDEAAVQHVLEVAGGLKSLVLGDAQIFSQLKEAYRIAVEEERVDTTMHRLLHTAFRTAKRIINETDLSAGAASIPHQAVEAAKNELGGRDRALPADARALIVGSGSMGVIAAESLRCEGVVHLSVTNRSEQRGRDGARRLQADFVPWDQRHEAAAEADLVIVATSAEDPVLYTDALRRAKESSPDRGLLLIIDISVPRNVERGVEGLNHVRVLNVDQLVHVTDEAEEERVSAVPDARAIVDEMHSEFVSWVFHHQALQPAIRAIAETFETIRLQEVSRHHQRFSEADRAELDRITKSILQKLLAVPIVRLKSVNPESIDFVHGIRLLHALFERKDCDDDVAGAHERPEAVGNQVREDCPIDPQLPGERFATQDADLDLDEVLRLFSKRDASSSRT